MKKLQALANRIKAVSKFEVEKEILRIIKENEQAIIELNQNQLLLDGKDSKGKKLPEYQSKRYKEQKRLINPAGVTDLRLTGQFYDAFFIDTSKLPIVIDSSDSKRNDLVKKYGKDIFGLDEESKRILYDHYLKENILAFYKKVLQL
jgi:hypothetical protein